jgi:uncharacterized protein (TIRG00374 family)
MKFPFIISMILSITIIIIILYFTIKPEDLVKLAKIQIRFEFFIIAFFLNFLSWCIWGLRLKILSNAADKTVKISWWKSTKIVMANLFLAGITPSMAGGEPVRIYLLKKEGMSTGCATAGVLGERLVDAIFLLICVPFALFILRDNLVEISGGIVGFGITIGVIVFLIVIFLFFYSITKPDKIKGFLIWLNKKLSRFSKKKEKQSKIVTRINMEVNNFHNSMMVFLKERRVVFFTTGIITLFMWLSAWFIPSMILLGLGLNPYFIEAIAAQVFLIIIIMMPTTPGAAGVTEGGAGGLYYLIIGASNLYLLGVFILIFRIITYFMNLVVGAFFQYRAFKSVASFSMDMIREEDIK